MTKPILLNTRPLALQQVTHDAFVENGFDVIKFPCIEIVDVEDSNKIFKQLTGISSKDTLIFTSQYAVRYAFKINPDFLNKKNKITIAVGTKTAHILEQNYTGDIWIPEQRNSEGVIDLLKGLANCQSIKLISAKNGRACIHEFANDLGINFEQINVYQRQIPTINQDCFKSIQQTDPVFVLATSVTTLHNLKSLLKGTWKDISNQTVVCASKRIQKAAQQLGFKNTLNCQTADPELMAKKLQSFIASKHN